MRLVRFYGNLPLRSKLLIWFLIISFITVLMVGVFSFVTSSRTAMGDEIEKKNIMLDVISENVYELLHDSELAAITVAHNHEVLQALGEESIRKETQINFLMTKILYIIDAGVDLHYINVFNRDGRVYTNLNDTFIVQETTQQYTDLSEELLSINHGIWGAPIVKTNKTIVLPHFRRIKDYSTDTVLGAVAIGINNDALMSCFNKYSKPNESIVILNENGITLSSENIHWIGRGFDEYFSSRGEPRLSDGYLEGKLGGKACLAVYHMDERTGLTFLSVTTRENMMAGPNSIIMITVLVMGIAILLGIFVAVLVSSTIAKPITKLVTTMDRVDDIDINHSFIPRYNDEVGKLAKSFNNMTNRLKKSMDKVLEEEQKRRTAEYNALKWQINPHFLYNTLSTIAWLANKGYTDEIIDMTKALSTLFRIGISKDKELITIGEELEHVESYLRIQKVRYQDKFKYILDIHPDLMGLFTVKISLQPLVENAIYHGVRDLNVMGLIRITGKIEDENVVISVMDNGGKLSQDEADRLNEFLSQQDNQDNQYGIGVRNVHDRIRFHFAGDYGLEFLIEKGFTVARIRMPVVDKPYYTPQLIKDSED